MCVLGYFEQTSKRRFAQQRVAIGQSLGRSHERGVERFLLSVAGPTEQVLTRLFGAVPLLCESAFGRLLEVTQDGTQCWEYVCPWFAQYPEQAARGFFPAESNALFRAYKYAKEQIPWL
jgi:hypothetical protein